MRTVEKPDLLNLLGPLLDPRERQRWRALAEMNKPLEAFLWNWPRFDPRFTRKIEPREVGRLFGDLRKLGAKDTCTVVAVQGPYFVVEGRLDSAIKDVLDGTVESDGQRARNVVVVCLPGRLGFFQDDYDTRGLLHRPA